MQLLNTRALALGGLSVFLLLASTTSLGLAGQSDPAPESVPNGPTREQIHTLMETMHGEGASERMHEPMAAAGLEPEQMMDQYVAMMRMMQQMQDMMDGSMMGDQIRGGRRDMMSGMMGP